MNRQKKGLSISKLAVACSLALTAQASAVDISNSKYETFYFDTTDNTPYYRGYASIHTGDTAVTGAIYPTIHNAVVNGVISTRYLTTQGDGNDLVIKNSTINGMITSKCMTADNCADASDIYTGPLNLTVDNSTINDTYEHYNYVDNAGNAGTIDIYQRGTAITLDQESNINIRNNSRIAGITLGQGYDWTDDTTAGGKTFDHNLTVNDSAITSGAWSELDNRGFYGKSGKPSDYDNTESVDPTTGQRIINHNDVALSVVDTAAATHSMKTNAVFNNSTLTGDVYFQSDFNADFYPNGRDSNADGVLDTNGGYVDDALNQDELNLTLDNGSKWVGAAISNVDSTANMYDVASNSIRPESVLNDHGHLAGADVFQSGLFNVKLDNGSVWDTRKISNIDTLAVNNGSQVNVEASALLADSITLNNRSSLNIGDEGEIATDKLILNNQSVATLTQEIAELYANNIQINNQSVLNLGKGQVDAQDIALANGGTFNIDSRDYVLNSNLSSSKSGLRHEQGVIALNSDGHLAVNGDVTGNFRVNINNATGEGSVADYKNQEVVRVYDNNRETAAATFTANNEADLGAYRYRALQQGDTVVLEQRGLTNAANIALSAPSANTNVWNMEQDTLSNRLTAARHAGDEGGVWATYFGGNYNGDNGVVSYDQDISGVMIGVDKMIEGDAKWTLGMSAGFAKADVKHKGSKLDQDSQSARLYASAKFDNNVFFDSSLSYSRFSNDLTSNMSNGNHVSGDNTTDAWGFGLKLGYDWAFNDKGFVTPYAAVSGLFQSNDAYRLSNNMAVGSQSYDSLRYEVGADVGYTFEYGNDQSLTPYARIAYVYDDAGDSDARINGDKIDNSMSGSAVRAGLGGQYNFSKNFAAYADANYLGGGDVDQDWSANVGVKYRW